MAKVWKKAGEDQPIVPKRSDKPFQGDEQGPDIVKDRDPGPALPAAEGETGIERRERVQRAREESHRRHEDRNERLRRGDDRYGRRRS